MNTQRDKVQELLRSSVLSLFISCLCAVLKIQDRRSNGGFGECGGGFLEATRGFRFELGLIDLVAAELFADTPARESAMRRAAVDPAGMAFENADQVGTFDPFGQFLRDVLKRSLEVEIEAERLFAR